MQSTQLKRSGTSPSVVLTNPAITQVLSTAQTSSAGKKTLNFLLKRSSIKPTSNAATAAKTAVQNPTPVVATIDVQDRQMF